MDHPQEPQAPTAQPWAAATQAVLAALFTSDDGAPAEDVLATVLEICRVACCADAAVVLRRVDEVTAIALASAPAALLPDGVTSPALLDRAGAE
ncbi:MAG TPA: hypothetical protein PLW65_32985, partial [Pseudomonadota bacterium]|nr:hypothetical protein [Pseudomonadota bacterium]